MLAGDEDEPARESGRHAEDRWLLVPLPLVSLWPMMPLLMLPGEIKRVLDVMGRITCEKEDRIEFIVSERPPLDPGGVRGCDSASLVLLPRDRMEAAFFSLRSLAGLLVWLYGTDLTRVDSDVDRVLVLLLLLVLPLLLERLLRPLAPPATRPVSRDVACAIWLASLETNARATIKCEMRKRSWAAKAMPRVTAAPARKGTVLDPKMVSL